jgi:hypothetical protein
LGFISAMTTKAVIAAIGTKLFLAKIIIVPTWVVLHFAISAHFASS